VRPIFQAIRLPEESSVKCWYVASSSFASRWHFHPEIEIKFVEHSRGLRLVGDSIAPFREGELVLMGPNLPHVWLSQPPRQPGIARCVVVQFLDSLLGQEFLGIPEFEPVADLIQRSRHGVLITGSDAVRIGGLMLEMPQANGADRVLLLLKILNLMARSRRQTLLCSADYTPKLNSKDAHRIAAVRRYVEDHLDEKISQPAAAALLRMGPAPFSRYFRKKMGCTFSTYIKQLRISRAIHLMVEEEMNISEACFASGFNNLSNFNHHFRAIKKMSPSAFLRQLKSQRPNDLEVSEPVHQANLAP